MRFPGENHELTRSGRPSLRVERFGIVAEWWAAHLAPGAPGPAMAGAAMGTGAVVGADAARP